MPAEVVFGIVSGAVGIATAFKACIECFEYIQVGRHLGRDFPTDLLILKGTQLRIQRWGNAVHIYEDARLGRPDATDEELQTVYNAIFQILTLFSDSQKIAKGYLESVSNSDLSLLTADDIDGPTTTALNWLQSISARGRSASYGFLKATKWAIYQRGELRQLISQINELFNNVERLFPALETRKALVQAEVAELANADALRLLQDASRDTDPLLGATIEEAMRGHTYKSVKVDSGSLVGDEFGEGWERGAIGKQHSYLGVTASKSMVGNKYGGPSFFTSAHSS